MLPLTLPKTTTSRAVASDRADIRSEGSLPRNVTAQRISIDEGALSKDGIDISKSGQRKHRMVVAAISSDHPQTGPPSSIITLKPAIRYQFKTGQRDWPKT
jgi:hypothetical protein